MLVYVISQNITQPCPPEHRKEANLHFHISKTHTVLGHLQGLTFLYFPGYNGLLFNNIFILTKELMFHKVN